MASTNPSEASSSILSDILKNPLSTTINGIEDETKIACIESQLKTTTMELINHEEKKVILAVESIDDETPPSLISPTSMLVSQSNHYNYPTRSKQQQQTINNSTNMNYNTSYPYPYPPTSSYNMQSYYYPSTTPMNYMPYYPTSSSPSSVYPPTETMYSNTPEQQSYYSSNDINSISYNGNGTTPFVYPTVQPSSTTSTTQRN